MQEALKELGISLKGTAHEEEIHGLAAWIAERTGKVDEEEAGILIMTATHQNHHYVVYAFTELSGFEKNEAVMTRILESFRPIEE